MGTRSFIGMKDEDGNWYGIYCHWDGYPENNGKLLLENYGDEAEVMELLSLGDLSSLGAEIGEQHDFDSENPDHMDWCTAYGRDRGEEDTEYRLFENQEDFLRAGWDSDAEYIYWFDVEQDRWFYCYHHDLSINELTEEVCNPDKEPA